MIRRFSADSTPLLFSRQAGYRIRGEYRSAEDAADLISDYFLVSLAAVERALPVAPETRVFYLDELRLNPPHKGKGWGSKFVKAIEADARRAGAAGVVLVASRLSIPGWTTMPHPKAFWQKMGYEEVMPIGIADAVMWKGL